MWRLTSCTTDSGSVASDSRATAPTTAAPGSKSTTDGVVGEPSAFGSTTGGPAWLTWATTENVVPRSMPNAVPSDTWLPGDGGRLRPATGREPGQPPPS